MAINSIGLSFFGPNKLEAKVRGTYDYADFTKRLMVHQGDFESPLYLKWRTAAGDELSESFDIAVNYHRLTHDFIYSEAIAQKRKKRLPLRREKRRHISRVIRVRTIVRIVMSPRICKRVFPVPRTRCATVDMEGKNSVFALTG